MVTTKMNILAGLPCMTHLASVGERRYFSDKLSPIIKFDFMEITTFRIFYTLLLLSNNLPHTQFTVCS